MEAILFDVTAFESVVAFLGGVALLATVAAAILLGSVAGKEARGEKVLWAEWPIPESGAIEPAETGELRKAA
ncbi:MAG: hypothetical protein ACM31I_10130 [Deltaproteobacteria bacterium]